MEIFVVKGASATGKSTRVKALMDYLIHGGFCPIEKEHNGQHLGYLFEEINLLVIGKFHEKNGQKRFQGWDSKTRVLNASALTEYMKNSKHNLLIEGAGITDTFRLRPKHLFEEVGVDVLFMFYYNYTDDQKEQYLERVMSRNGKHPNKDAGWNKRNNFRSDYNNSIKEVNEIEMYNRCLIFNYSYDEPIKSLGEVVLHYYNHIIEECDFVEYCCKNYDF